MKICRMHNFEYRHGELYCEQVPVSRIADIVRSNRSITADTALRLGAYLGTSAQMWLNLQASYDLRLAETSYWPEAKARIRARA